MNGKMMLYLIGQIMRLEAILMLFPALCAAICREDLIPFLIPIVLLALAGTLLTLRSPQKRDFSAREGFLTVGLSWIILSLFGALPLFLCGKGLSFIDCFFEIVSGFTTTGATILGGVPQTIISSFPKGILFWRSFTHWIGGMGVLVFVLAILPRSDMRNTKLMYLMRAEVPGPKVDKIVSKLTHTARILYGLYIALTALEVMLLLCGGMSVYDSLVHAFGTAGTGGFSVKDAGIGEYGSAYFDWVIGVFMVLFGINFNLYYLILCGHIGKALRSEELWWYLGIIGASVAAITVNIVHMYTSLPEAIRASFFQVASIITTTGYSTVDFNAWPTFAKTVLVTLMFIGACAGSTGGGIKVGRVILLVKNGIREIRYSMHPRSIISVRSDGKKVDHEIIRGTTSFMIIYLLIFIFSVLFVAALDGFDPVTCFTSVAACLNNIGPGLGMVGPAGTFAPFSALSKLLLSFDMLAGRLEIFPILMLFSPSAWRKR